MRILTVVRNLAFGGVERRSASLVQGYAAAGHAVLVVCLRDDGEWVDEVRAAGIDVTVLGLGHGADPRGVIGLARAIREFRPDVIDAQQTRPNILSRLALILAAARSPRTARARVPVVCSSYLIDNWRNPAIRVFERASFRRAAYVVTDSERLAKDLRRRADLPDDRVVVIPNGVADARDAPAVPGALDGVIGGAGPLVVHVGRLVPYKGQGVFLDAVERVLREGCEGRFLVVGDGDSAYARELRARVARPPLEGSAAVMRWDGEIGSLLQLADVFTLASSAESSPMAILEAMSAGLPVIATDVGGISEAVSDGETGFLVPVGGPDGARVDDLAIALQRVVTDPELARQLGEAGRRQFEKRHSVPLMVANALEVLERARS